MPDLERAIQTVVDRCLAVQPGEDVLVIADPATEALALGLRGAAEQAGADAVLALMSEREENGTEPPAPVAAALQAADVFIAPTTKSLSHTQARKRASDNGARGATLPGVTAEMLGRVMAVDLDTLKQRSRAVADLLTASDEAHLTCPRGTDLTIDLTGRTGLSDDGDLTAPGAFGNLPCGEGFVAPAGGRGRLLASSLASVGLATEEPVEIEVDDGRLTSCAHPDFVARLDAPGPDGRHLAELGVGTNDRATLTGNVLEDEKILGTVHVAFGASAGIGGTVSVPVHLDVVVTDATLTIGATPVLRDGSFVLDAG